MILKYLVYGLVFLIMSIIGYVIYPFIYLIYDEVYCRKVKPLWWFLNSDEPTYNENKYGANWWQEEKGIKLNTWYNRFFASYRWVALRNPHYNLKLELVPLLGTPYNIRIIKNTTGKSGMVLCDHRTFGMQIARFKVGGEDYFSMSWTLWFGFFYHNVQLGVNEKRYLYKMKFWNKNKIATLKKQAYINQ